MAQHISSPAIQEWIANLDEDQLKDLDHYCQRENLARHWEPKGWPKSQLFKINESPGKTKFFCCSQSMWLWVLGKSSQFAKDHTYNHAVECGDGSMQKEHESWAEEECQKAQFIYENVILHKGQRLENWSDEERVVARCVKSLGEPCEMQIRYHLTGQTFGHLRRKQGTDLENSILYEVVRAQDDCVVLSLSGNSQLTEMEVSNSEGDVVATVVAGSHDAGQGQDATSAESQEGPRRKLRIAPPQSSRIDDWVLVALSVIGIEWLENK